VTLATTSNTTVVQGNGLTTSFDFSFPVPNASELFVYLTNPGSSPVLLSNSQYSTTGVGTGNGGSVNYPLAGSPVPTGSSLTIQREVPYVQLTSLVDQSGYYPNVVENALDYLTMQTQQLAQGEQLTLTVPLESTIADLVLPTAAGRADSLVGFDPNGNATTYPISSSVGAGNMTLEGPFLSGSGFTPGVTTTLTLSKSYGSAANVQVHFDGLYQGPDQYAISGTQVVFNSPIPAGVSAVYVVGGTTLSVGTPAAGTVNDSSVASGSLLYNRINDQVWVTDCGAVLGQPDSSSAFIAAANKCKTRGGGAVRIPAGTWNISTTIPSYPNVEFIGEGEFATILVPTTASMTLFSQVNSILTISYSAFRNFTIAPIAASVIGVQLTLCRFTQLENINFLGCGQNFVIDRGYFHTLENLMSEGSSLFAAGSATLTSSVDTDYVYHSTISNYTLVNQGTGVPVVGLYMRRAIDFDITDVHAYGATGCDIMIVENDSQAVKIKGLNVDACTAGVILRQGSGVAVCPTFTSIANSHVDQAQAFGIQLNGAIATTLTDVMFTPNVSHVNIPALALNNDTETIVNGCQFSGFSGSGGAGVQMSASINALIHNNSFLGCSIGVGFSGSPTNVSVRNNQFPSTTAPIAGVAAGTGNCVSGNQGILSSSVSVALPSSGVGVTNTTGYNCMVTVSAGTVSLIAINGITTGLTSGTFTVKVGDSIAVTYSSAPNFAWIAQQ